MTKNAPFSDVVQKPYKSDLFEIQTLLDFGALLYKVQTFIDAAGFYFATNVLLTEEQQKLLASKHVSLVIHLTWSPTLKSLSRLDNIDSRLTNFSSLLPSSPVIVDFTSNLKK